MRKTKSYQELQKTIAKVEYENIQIIMAEMIKQKRTLRDKLSKEIRNLKNIRKTIPKSELSNLQTDLVIYRRKINKYESDILGLKKVRKIWNILNKDGKVEVNEKEYHPELFKTILTIDKNYITKIEEILVSESIICRISESERYLTPIKVITMLINKYNGVI